MEYLQEHIGIVVRAAEERQAVSRPVRILDIATGGNDFNPLLLQELSKRGIDYKFVMSDVTVEITSQRLISNFMRGGFARGYDNIVGVLSSSELQRVIPVFADATDLRKQVDKVFVYKEPIHEQLPLEQILANPEYSFMLKGYDGTKRRVSFEDESFDIVIGIMPFESVEKYEGGKNCIPEVASEVTRVLKKGGLLIVEEDGPSKVNYFERTKLALRKIAENPAQTIRLIIETGASIYHARKTNLKELEAALNNFLKFQETIEHPSVCQRHSQDIRAMRHYGEERKDFTLVYQK